MSGFVILEDAGPYRATRDDVKGTVTFKKNGPQWGAFHPLGDETNSIPIEKWDSHTLWWEPCELCGEPVEIGWGTLEVVGAYHSGCFGYPMCSCLPPHRGECMRGPRQETAE